MHHEGNFSITFDNIAIILIGLLKPGRSAESLGMGVMLSRTIQEIKKWASDALGGGTRFLLRSFGGGSEHCALGWVLVEPYLGFCHDC